MVVDVCIYLFSLATDVCTECGHEIAAHTYEFSIVEEFQVSLFIAKNVNCYNYVLQEYSMECNLCGHGEATVSILPDDPREQQLF